MTLKNWYKELKKSYSRLSRRQLIIGGGTILAVIVILTVAIIYIRRGSQASNLLTSIDNQASYSVCLSGQTVCTLNGQSNIVSVPLAVVPTPTPTPTTPPPSPVVSPTVSPVVSPSPTPPAASPSPAPTPSPTPTKTPSPTPTPSPSPSLIPSPSPSPTAIVIQTPTEQPAQTTAEQPNNSTNQPQANSESPRVAIVPTKTPKPVATVIPRITSPANGMHISLRSKYITVGVLAKKGTSKVVFYDNGLRRATVTRSTATNINGVEYRMFSVTFSAYRRTNRLKASAYTSRVWKTTPIIGVSKP